MNREAALETMKEIMQNYIYGKTTRCQAVEQLIHRIDINYILDIDITNNPDDFMITDCYWTIKYLTEDGYEMKMTRNEYSNARASRLPTPHILHNPYHLL